MAYQPLFGAGGTPTWAAPAMAQAVAQPVVAAPAPVASDPYALGQSLRALGGHIANIANGPTFPGMGTTMNTSVAQALGDVIRGASGDPVAAPAAAPTLAKAVVQAVTKPAATAATTASAGATPATTSQSKAAEDGGFAHLQQLLGGIAKAQGGQLSLGQILTGAQAASAVSPHYAYRGNYRDDISSDMQGFAHDILSEKMAQANALKNSDPAAASKAAQAAVDEYAMKMQPLMGAPLTMAQQMQQMQVQPQVQQ